MWSRVYVKVYKVIGITKCKSFHNIRDVPFYIIQGISVLIHQKKRVYTHSINHTVISIEIRSEK